ncbi:hypothetical protein EJ08DRAFT_644952 [Tothia fuscella]|uniref:Cupin n=1 Tax=Tothia fuscella TaxID=1048955 RepID=A0A9P4P4K5_9PEZI|nr:hypothetical protein EJ08DRAFT_644952 [Tothia fuscella]
MTTPQPEAEKEIKSWGFDKVLTWSDPPNAHYAPHSHSVLTTHLILSGELTIGYREDASPKKETYTSGMRLDVEAGRKHEAWIGKSGATMAIGE